MTPIECTIIIGYLCKCISDYMITTIYSFGKKAIELLMVFANNHGNGLSTVLTIVHYILCQLRMAQKKKNECCWALEDVLKAGPWECLKIWEGHNLPPLVDIGLADLQNLGAMAPLAHSAHAVPTPLQGMCCAKNAPHSCPFIGHHFSA